MIVVHILWYTKRLFTPLICDVFYRLYDMSILTKCNIKFMMILVSVRYGTFSNKACNENIYFEIELMQEVWSFTG